MGHTYQVELWDESVITVTKHNEEGYNKVASCGARRLFDFADYRFLDCMDAEDNEHYLVLDFTDVDEGPTEAFYELDIKAFYELVALYLVREGCRTGNLLQEAVEAIIAGSAIDNDEGSEEVVAVAHTFRALDAVKKLVQHDKNVLRIELEKLPPQMTLAGTLEESQRAVVITFRDVNKSDWFSQLNETMRNVFSNADDFKVMYGDGDTMLVLIR